MKFLKWTIITVIVIFGYAYLDSIWLEEDMRKLWFLIVMFTLIFITSENKC